MIILQTILSIFSVLAGLYFANWLERRTAKREFLRSRLTDLYAPLFFLISVANVRKNDNSEKTLALDIKQLDTLIANNMHLVTSETLTAYTDFRFGLLSIHDFTGECNVIFVHFDKSSEIYPLFKSFSDHIFKSFHSLRKQIETTYGSSQSTVSPPPQKID